MPLGMHEGLKQNLQQRLVEKLTHLEVIKGVGVSTVSKDALAGLNAALPGHGQIYEKVAAWISDQPFSDFVVSELNIDLQKTEWAGRESVKLTDVEGFENFEALAEDIVTRFEELPYSYVITTPAPDNFTKLLGDHTDFTFASRIRLIQPDDEFIQQHPISTGDDEIDKKIWDISLLGSFQEPYKWQGPHFQIITVGFIGRLIETNTEHELKTDFKALWGVLMALGLAMRRNSWTAYPSTRKLITHRIRDTGLSLVGRIEMDAPNSKLASDLRFNDWMDEKSDQTTKLRVYQSYYEEIEQVFTDNENSKRLRLASSWLFDSYATDNELLAYVQAMVCLEIILGDASLIGEIGLGELLRNRCAYLIGKSSQQRAEILSDFRDIYDVRSHIVHRGKSRMTASERTLYAKLLWYCRRCINEEINMLKQDKMNDKAALTA